MVLASGGYPVKYDTGKEISGLDADGQRSGATVYHAGNHGAGGRQVLVTAGGRVLGVTADGRTRWHRRVWTAPTPPQTKIHFDGAHCRNDIGTRRRSQADRIMSSLTAFMWKSARSTRWRRGAVLQETCARC